MSDNLNIDLKKFAENAKKIKKVKEDFDKCLNAEIVELEVSIKKLFGENEQVHIYNQLVKLDLNSITVPKVGRVQTILDFVAQEYLDKYRNQFLTNNARKEFPETPKRPEGKDKTVIKEFNETVQKWQKEVKEIKDWNTKYNTLTEYLDSIITVDLYGDTTLNVANLPYVYFKFMNTDIDEIEVFIQELKTCPASPVKKIKSIKIEDIKDKLPDFVKSAKEVRVYFDTIQEAEELHGSADYVGSVYEKYVVKNDLMKKDGGEWGIFNKRKNNLANPVVGGFSLIGAPSPVNLNSGQSYALDEEFYEDDYVVSLTDCYYAEAEIDGDDIFAIVPKEFWDKYKSILVNKKMTITGITDNSKFTRKEIYFMYMGDVTEGNNYISDEAEFSTELSEYLDTDSQLSPFKRKLKVLLGVDSFDKKDWINNCETYNLSEVQGFPDTEKLIAKLTPKAEMEFYKQAGVNSKNQYEDEIGYEDQDLENCDLVSLTDTELEIRCGGDWQAPASITFGLKDDKIVVIDYYLEDIENKISSNNTVDEEEIEDEIEEEEDVTCSSAKDFVWSITIGDGDVDEYDDDTDPYIMLAIVPKEYWNKKQCMDDRSSNAESFIMKGYKLEEFGASTYTLCYGNDKYVTKISEVILVLSKSEYEYSFDMQNWLDKRRNSNINSNNFSSKEEYFDALKNV